MASAAILLGGQARRFGGRDKSALVLDRRAILDHQLTVLRELTDDILLVGAPTEQARGGVRAIPDRMTGCGPLAGLDAALAAARDETLLLLACDMPCVTGPFLAYLLGLTGTADAVVPRTERGYHPLCAAYTRACRPVVARRVDAHQLKMLDMLDEVRVRPVDGLEIGRFGESDRLLANVNTPAEWDTLGTLLGHTR